ncbi:MAG: LysR family transcriptional regulator [Oscillibacter sp.]|nr:LysR family transcriptional regulator [Oscillibacter sp.]
MKLAQLQYFRAVSEWGSFTKAASLLHITQPSLSKAISELEQEAGVPLLVRTRNGAVLTPEGNLFFQQTLRVLEEFDKLSQVMEDMKTQEHTVKVGIPPTIGFCYISKIAEALAQSGLNLRLLWKEGGTAALGQQVLSNTLDAAILPSGFFPMEKLSGKRLRTMEEVLYVSRRHPLAELPYVTEDLVREETFILFTEDYNQNVPFQDLFGRSGFFPRHVTYTSQLSTALHLIQQNMAVSILVRDIFNDEQLTCDIVPIPLKPPYFLDLTVIWRTQKRLPKWFQGFLNVVAAALTE